MAEAPITKPPSPTRHVLDVDDLGPDGLAAVLALAESDPADLAPVYHGQGVALLFEKPSNRTRNSSEMAVVALGGHPVYIQGHEVGLDVRETAADVARTLACYHSVLCARVIDHGSLGGWRRPSTRPECRCRWSTCCPTGPIPARRWPTC